MHGPGYAPQPPDRRPGTAVLITLRVVFVALSLLGFGLLSWAAMLRLAIVRGRRLDWVLFGITFVTAIGIIVLLGELESSSTSNSPKSEEPADMTPLDIVAALTMIALAIGVSVHYLVADIRHYQRPFPAAAGQPSPYSVTPPIHGLSAPPHPPAGYGYPPQGPATPAPGYGYPPGRPPAYGYPSNRPAPASPPPRPPARPTPRPTPTPAAPSPYTATPPTVPAPSPYTAQAPQQPPPHQQQPDPVAYPTPPPVAGTPRIDQVRAELDELSDYLRKEQGR
ncbi:hypothetical protein GCM10010387_16660 [Streptomyces inusitatus]|uniref:Integral membrane protein n=1 Tax=Streptomyces inusitatus TaxID=68221 RepID=A0A918UP07_9ACTN|nr:hypothetical protein [Streptomyces inusitatus]GGZ24039.1 hypothetical protein GCM10010387_16660 [Streptomyces inusitatus]